MKNKLHNINILEKMIVLHYIKREKHVYRDIRSMPVSYDSFVLMLMKL